MFLVPLTFERLALNLFLIPRFSANRYHMHLFILIYLPEFFLLLFATFLFHWLNHTLLLNNRTNCWFSSPLILPSQVFFVLLRFFHVFLPCVQVIFKIFGHLLVLRYQFRKSNMTERVLTFICRYVSIQTPLF